MYFCVCIFLVFLEQPRKDENLNKMTKEQIISRYTPQSINYKVRIIEKDDSNEKMCNNQIISIEENLTDITFNISFYK